MEDTLKLVVDSLLHTIDQTLHSIPGEGSDFIAWIVAGVSAIIAFVGWWKYKQAMKRK